MSGELDRLLSLMIDYPTAGTLSGLLVDPGIDRGDAGAHPAVGPGERGVRFRCLGLDSDCGEVTGTGSTVHLDHHEAERPHIG